MSSRRRAIAAALRRAGPAIFALGLAACAITWAPGPAGAQTVYDQGQPRGDCAAPSLAPSCSGDNLDPGGQDQGAGKPGAGGNGSGGGGGNGNGGGGGNGNGGGGGGGGLGDTTGQVDAGDDEETGVANPLSISNPLCSELSGSERERCRFGQGPESLIPVSNYQLDIYADDSGSGTDAIVGNFQKMLAAIANGIWMILVLALKGVFAFLGWAFSLAPFSNDRATSRVDSGLENFYANFTSPWLVFGFVCLGAWALYRGVVRREMSQTAGGLVLSLALMLVALWIIHEPRESIGRASGIVDDAALSVIAAPETGSLSDPVGGYSESTERAWHIMTTAPWAALQFSDTSWALGPPNAELKDYMWDDVDRYCSDEQFSGDRGRCETFRALHGEPKSNVELLLASSPGSQSRGDDMWNEGFGDEHPDVIAKMAMQSGSGAPLRLPVVGLFAIGLLGALLLFMWIVIRLFVQTAIAFVLVLSAPIALFFPAFGEKGRQAFTVWGGTLIGAIIAKLIYAALLAIVLFGTRVIFGMVGSSNEGISVTMGFLLASGFWWAIFLKRQEIAGFFSLSDKGEGGAGRIGAALGVYGAARLGGKVAKAGWGALSGGRKGGATPFGGADRDSREEPRSTDAEQASGQLDQRARERLDSERAGAERTLAAGAARQEEAARLRGDADREEARAGSATGRDRERALANAQKMRRHAAALDREGRKAAPAERRAAKLVERAGENEARSGRAFGPAEVAESREALRNNLNKPVESGVHGHYVGKSAREYEALSGRERELAHREVAARLKEDKAAFGVIPDAPGRIPRERAGAFRSARREAIGADAYRAEREAARRLQKARRTYRRRRRRSGVSR